MRREVGRYDVNSSVACEIEMWWGDASSRWYVGRYSVYERLGIRRLLIG
jgi:hypothetical protein